MHLLIDVIEHAEPGGTVRFGTSHEGEATLFVIERIEAGASGEATRRTVEASGLDPDKGLALWQRIGSLMGATVTMPHGPRSRPGYRIAVATFRP